jgi:hypothetical protein
MIGIIVDTNIIKELICKIMPQLGPILDDKNDFLGDIIGYNFINKGLTNLFSNGMLDEDLALLIWDYLFLEGSTVLIKAFLAIYSFLSDKIINGKKTLEYFTELVNEEIQNIKLDNDTFIYNLFFEYDKYLLDFDLNLLRYENSLILAENVEELNIEHLKTKIQLFYDKKFLVRQMGKTISCNKKWPYCINDTYFENVTKVFSYIVFKESDNKYINNYFFSEDHEKEKNKEEEEKNNLDYYKIRIERRSHYCNEIQNEINKEENNINKNK